MHFTLFFAWQSDSPLDDNKHLIRDAAKAALKRITQDAEVEDAPRLDQDTKGLPGTPEVANAIFNKIKEAGIFLGDVTLIGSSRSADGRSKKFPNANVCIETGYAGASVGWDRIILVMNTAKEYGTADEQTFDIKHRRNPICYELPAGSDEAQRGDVRGKLSETIEAAVRASMKYEHQRVTEVISCLDQHCLQQLVTYGQSDSIVISQISGVGAGGLAIAFQQHLHTISRLLELRLLACHSKFNADASAASYEYRWTYLGRQAARQMGIRHD